MARRCHATRGLLFAPLFLALLLVGAACDSAGDDAPGADAVGGADVPANPTCADASCPDHSTCQPSLGSCVCDAGYEPLGSRCVAIVEPGPDVIDPGPDVVAPGPDVIVPEDVVDPADVSGPDLAGSVDVDTAGEDVSELQLCPVPVAPTLPIIHVGAELLFTLADDTLAIETGTAAGAEATVPDAWTPDDTVVLDASGPVTVFARVADDACTGTHFVAVYDVREGYPGDADTDDTTAVPMDAPGIAGWATGVAEVNYGADVAAEWQTPDRALGPAAGNAMDILCLGRGGDATLTFEPPITDGPGYDLAVFENSFSDTFIELAFVEVSSDGVTFLRFDSASLGDSAVDGFGNLEASLIGGLAGVYRQGFGTPFDLAVLANRPEVRAGTVDLSAITHVRLVDIRGDGSVQDSFGHPIYDPYPTVGSAGFDLDAIAALNR